MKILYIPGLQSLDFRVSVSCPAGLIRLYLLGNVNTDLGGKDCQQRMATGIGTA